MLLTCTTMMNNMESKRERKRARKSKRKSRHRVIWFGDMPTSTGILTVLLFMPKRI